MFTNRTLETADDLDDSRPLPELTFYDLDLDPPSTSKDHQVNTDDVDEDDDDDVDEEDYGEEEEFLSISASDSLNTPRNKKAQTVRVLENKRIVPPAAPIGTALKNMLGGIRVVTTPTKTSPVTDVKILNKLQPKPLKTFSNAPIRIGSTTIATPPVAVAGTAISAAAVPAMTAKNVIGGVTMTQIKTADGKILYLQKSLPATGEATVKLPVSATTGRMVTQSTMTSGGIRQAILSKGVTLTTSGLLKNASTVRPITVKGLTAVSSSKPSIPSTTLATASTATTATTLVASTTTATAATSVPTVANKLPIQVLRTADGKLIKLNQGTSPILLNTKAAAIAVKPAGTTQAAIPTTNLNSKNSANVVISKPAPQVIIKGPLKQLPAGSALKPIINSTSGTSSTAVTLTTTSSSISSAAPSATTTAATMPVGKLLVQSSTGKQIVVASKNIIKLSPKPGASVSTSPSAVTNTGTTASPAPGGLHAIQLPGKSGVQYVRVLPSSNSNSISNSNSKTITSPQKVSLGRPRTGSNSNSNSTTNANANNSSSSNSSNIANTSSSNATVTIGNTSKIVMKTMGGSIVPLPSMQTLVPRRAPGTATATVQGKASGSSSLEAARKHRLSDLNVQIKQLNSESGSDTAAGPDAKKARYVIAMQPTSSSGTSTSTTPATQQQMQKTLAARPTQVQRITVQGANVASSSSSGTPTRKIYNLITKSDTNGVKYMICNKSGDIKPRTVFNTTMRRGYTLAEPKLRRPIQLTSQQVRFKQIKSQQQRQILAQAQAKQRLRLQQHQQQQQQQKVQSKSPQQEPGSTHEKLSVPTKPLFEILKPASTPAPAAAPAPASADALGGTRRKHCNCSKSQCLKLYCDCFANGEFCQDCTCKDCFNNMDYEVKRERAIRSCLERNPSAFKPKITAPNSGDMRLHNKGCNCKRSGCLKNYCECYEAKIPCSSMCKCVGCRNMEDRPDVDMDSIDSLVDIKQHSKMKEINGTAVQENRSNVYLTDDVIEATIMCMISRIVLHEKQNLPMEDTEREVMEELGESLNQIITFAKEKNDTAHTEDPKTTA